MLSDGELLRRYVQDRSEAAFTELVQRHINVVYRTALRRVGGNAHAADDAAQRVFTDLARKASALLGRSSLAGWLYTSTRFAAAQIVRAERRRRTHEEEAHTMHELETHGAVDFRRMEPFLDEAMEALSDRDREAVLLHFFEGRTFAETGAMLSLSSDACRMRVNRALDALRAGFAKRGVASSAAALAATLSTQSAMAAPSSLAATVAAQALSEAAAFGAHMSLAVKMAQAIKGGGLAAWGGAAATVVVIGIVFSFSRAHRAELPESASRSAVVENALPAALPAASMPAAADNSTALQLNDMSVAPSTAASVASKNIAPATSSFAALSPAEKRLLAIFWTSETNHPPAPGMRRALRVPPLGPNFSGRDLLIGKGWAEANAQGGIHLTDTGHAFCLAHADELAAEAESIDFSQIHFIPVGLNLLSSAERRVLAMLWTWESSRPAAPGIAQNLRFAPGTAGARGGDSLVGRGWVAVGAQGGLHLTKEGRGFCREHASELATEAASIDFSRIKPTGGPGS